VKHYYVKKVCIFGADSCGKSTLAMKFAKLQYEAVNSMVYFANKVLICDTDNITTEVYSQVYCGYVLEKIKLKSKMN